MYGFLIFWSFRRKALYLHRFHFALTQKYFDIEYLAVDAGRNITLFSKCESASRIDNSKGEKQVILLKLAIQLMTLDFTPSKPAKIA